MSYTKYNKLLFVLALLFSTFWVTTIIAQIRVFTGTPICSFDRDN
jgi:hypothetical protein